MSEETEIISIPIIDPDDYDNEWDDFLYEIGINPFEEDYTP